MGGRGMLFCAILLFTALAISLPFLTASPAAGPESTCGKFGTSVAFVDSPSVAGRQAAKEEKLVFVLHVSGHFEDPRFT